MPKIISAEEYHEIMTGIKDERVEEAIKRLEDEFKKTEDSELKNLYSDIIALIKDMDEDNVTLRRNQKGWIW